ncbi:hypothetical protein JTB14_036532 [Gonioctena quinquepunctata]|nr:hypothetical protein JTB14_036532 [Gonioctena quinquepunctata]
MEENINEFLTRRNGLYHMVKNAGFEFSDKVQAGFAVLGLPSQYVFLARNLRADEDDLNLSKLKSKLLQEERRIENKMKEDGEIEITKAFISKRNFKQYKKRESNQFTRKQKFQHSHEFLRCYPCLEMGHIGKHCPLSGPKDKEDNKGNAGTSSRTAFSSVNSRFFNSSHKANRKIPSNFWILDSGATDHMTFQR